MQESQFVGYDKLLLHEFPNTFHSMVRKYRYHLPSSSKVCISPKNAEHYTAPYDSLPMDNKLEIVGRSCLGLNSDIRLAPA